MKNIKGVIFDLDGVLVDSKNIHFLALNSALKKNNFKKLISYEDHIKIYDGLPTKIKLKKLFKNKLAKSAENKIIKEKNKLTKMLLNQEISYNKNIESLFKSLYNKGYKLAVATNAIRETLNLCIGKLKIKKYLSFSLSNQDVTHKKPHPEIYLKCLIRFGLKPSEVMVLEDSINGRESVLDSGCHLLPIKSLKDVNLKNVYSMLKKLNQMKSSIKTKKWNDPDLNVLIPMAGKGSRFADAGYTFPKPLIEIHGMPMIHWVVKSLKINANYIFIVQKEHEEKYNISTMLNLIEPKCKIIFLDTITEGAACTTLLAEKYINNDKPLLISNSDQYLEWDSSKILYNFVYKKVDGGILTFNSIHPKWSYAKVENNYVTEVAEKKVISKNATAGIYYWKKGKDYINYAKKMVSKNIRVNNEFYVCPVFNEAIADNKKIVISAVKKMWGLGTPEDLDYFLKNYNNIDTN